MFSFMSCRDLGRRECGSRLRCLRGMGKPLRPSDEVNHGSFRFFGNTPPPSESPACSEEEETRFLITSVLSDYRAVQPWVTKWEHFVGLRCFQLGVSIVPSP
jgi:hypothetical protein